MRGYTGYDDDYDDSYYGCLSNIGSNIYFLWQNYNNLVEENDFVF